MHADFKCYEGVFSILLNLKAKACGPDKIPNAFLHGYGEVLAHFVTVIFRVSFLLGTLANDWLKARVVPVSERETD